MTSSESKDAKAIVLDPPLITVRFREGAAPAWGPEATAEVAATQPEHWAELEDLFPGLELVPLFEGVSREVIEALMLRGKRRTPTYRPADFLSMFRVKLPRKASWNEAAPDGTDLSSALRKLILEHLPVERVSVETVAAPPPYQDGAGGLNQLYLDVAPRGLDVLAAWGELGGKGEGEVLADVERGWHVSHPELTGVAFNELPGGMNNVGDKPHGTSVLSVALARENPLSVVGVPTVVGVAPQVTSVVLSSEMRLSGTIITEAAIMDAIVVLAAPGAQPGAVLLLEAQKYLKEYDLSISDLRKGPVEMKPEVYEVIQLAVANHIIVIEAAGNGASDNAGIGLSLDLDVYATPATAAATGKPVLLHGDSGAIMVGQSQWTGAPASVTNSHVEVLYGCSGKRIDCFGWGSGVQAASVITSRNPYSSVYNTGFNLTSAASAMIAGAALVVQGLVRHGITGVVGYLTPPMMRALLRDTTLNTHLASGVADLIGVMPNLANIVERLQALPDIYIRDNKLDTGDPTSGQLCRSPDIILKMNPLPAGTTPDDAFGELTNTVDDDALSDVPIPGGKAFVYVRLRNRGLTAVAGAKVTVWYVGPGTLLHPVDWKVIGQADIDVPINDVLTVAGPIEWAAVPNVPHFCMIALVRHPDDPGFISSTFSLTSTSELTVPDDFNDIEYFKTYISHENNVAWRKFNPFFVPWAPFGPSPMPPLDADVAGPGDGGDEEMDFRIDSRMPLGSIVDIELPHPLAGGMKRLPPGFKEDKKTKARRGKVPTSGVTRLGLARLAAKARHRVRVRVKLPKEFVKAGEVALIQLHKGVVVGRVTWRFVPGNPPHDSSPPEESPADD